jgi:hypothetical protein
MHEQVWVFILVGRYLCKVPCCKISLLTCPPNMPFLSRRIESLPQLPTLQSWLMLLGILPGPWLPLILLERVKRNLENLRPLPVSWLIVRGRLFKLGLMGVAVRYGNTPLVQELLKSEQELDKIYAWESMPMMVRIAAVLMFRSNVHDVLGLREFVKNSLSQHPPRRAHL